MSNPKHQGEKGQKVVIGELAKLDIDCLIPLSDNLPYDLVVDFGGKLLKIQVKSSSISQSQNSRHFSLVTNNWYAKTRKKYTKAEIDLMFLCDLETYEVFVIGPEDFDGRAGFTIRCGEAKNGQKKGMHLADDFRLTRERLRTLA